MQIDRSAGMWTAGFFPVGILLGAIGSLLIGWQYHIGADPRLIGLHFLGLNAGYVIAVAMTPRALDRVSTRLVAIAASAFGTFSLLALSFAFPPVPAIFRVLGLASVGASGGILVTALLYALEPYLAEAPAATANRAGIMFGCGCSIATATVGIAYFASSVQIETALLAAFPAVYMLVFGRSHARSATGPLSIQEERRTPETLRDVRRIATVLFSALLFFQFGNEWAIAGWLPLFLIDRLGTNPAWAIFALAAYFAALTCGRLLVRCLPLSVSHRKLLLVSVGLAMAGYLLLSLTPSIAGAWLAVIVIGVGFSPIYPILAETLDDRFSYHPGFYNGMFSIAITGAMFGPWLLGYVDSYLGIQYVMLVPAFGSVAVLLLALLIMLEARLTGDKRSDAATGAVASAGGD